MYLTRRCKEYEIAWSGHCLGHIPIVSHEKHCPNFVYIYVTFPPYSQLDFIKVYMLSTSINTSATQKCFYPSFDCLRQKYIVGGSTTTMLEARSAYRKSSTKPTTINSSSNETKKREACGSTHQTKALQLPLRFSSLFPAASMGINASMCPYPLWTLKLTRFHSKYKSWKVTGFLPWSALLFTAGFITRTIGAFGQWGNIGIFIASTVLLLAGP